MPACGCRRAGSSPGLPACLPGCPSGRTGRLAGRGKMIRTHQRLGSSRSWARDAVSHASISSKVQPARWVSCSQLAADVIKTNTATARSGVVPLRQGAHCLKPLDHCADAGLLPARPFGDYGSSVWFGGRSREQHLDEIPAAFVQLAGEMDCLGDHRGRVGFREDLGAELRHVGLLIDEVVEGQDQRGLGTNAGIDGLHRYPGLLGDLLQGRAGVALGGEQPPGSPQDLAAGLRSGHRRACWDAFQSSD